MFTTDYAAQGQAARPDRADSGGRGRAQRRSECCGRLKIEFTRGGRCNFARVHAHSATIIPWNIIKGREIRGCTDVLCAGRQILEAAGVLNAAVNVVDA